MIFAIYLFNNGLFKKKNVRSTFNNKPTIVFIIIKCKSIIYA